MAKKIKGVLAQGTKVWIKHGPEDTPVLTKMNCIKAINLGEDSRTEIDSTCLDDEDSSSANGLNKPGAGSLGINTDPENLSHVKLLALAEEDEVVDVYVGWSDNKKVEPEFDSSTGEVTLPETRTWTTFQARLNDNPPTFESDSLVEQTIGMKRQTKARTQLRTTSAP